MLNRSFAILLLTYYMAGAMLFPLGDFGILPRLPAMYSHCKAVEHPDMNFYEFITDHLVNIDGIFDAHDEEGDDQKPHSPESIHYIFQQVFYTVPAVGIINEPGLIQKETVADALHMYYDKDYLPSIFKPPIVLS